MPWSDRLVAYAPGTDTRLGYLPEPLSWQASLPHNDAGALSLTYSTLAAGGDLLTAALADGLDIGLELDWGAGWTEPKGARFALIGRSLNPADKTGSVTLTCPSYGWILGKVRNLALEMLEADGDFAGQRLYEDASAGAIMRSQLDEYASRHAAAPALLWGFSAANDSAGVAWTDRRTIPYEAGVDARTILAGLASMGMCDWRTVGRTLALYKADTITTNLSDSVRLELGRDVSDAPSTETLEDVAGYTLVRGEGAVVTTVTEPTAPAAWGAWESYLSASGATTEAEAQTAVASDVERRARAAGEYTRQLLINDEASWLPLRDYEPGDIVTAWAVSDRAAMRVQQITLSRDGQGVRSGSVVLNDRLVPKDLQTARRVNALLSGAVLAGSGAGRGTNDQRTPAAPSGLTLAEQRYQDAQGVWRSAIGATWSPVTVSTGATAMAVASYELWGTPGAGQARRLTSTPGTSAAWQPFETGSVWSFAVVAVGANGKRSAASAAVSWTFGHDTIAPLQPAPPALSSRLGALLVEWSGKDYLGVVQASDWRHTEVHVSAVAGFTPSASTLVDVISSAGGGQVPVFDLTYGSTYYVRLVSVDWSGNRSVPSAAVSGVPVAVVSRDIAGEVQDAIDAAYDEALAAQGTANAALASADGKNRVYYQTTQPSGGTYVVGDTWFDTDAGNRIYRWSGSAWVAQTLGASALQDSAITAAKIATGAVLSDAIADAAVDTAELADSAVTTVKIANLAVGSAKIADAAIVRAKIGDAAVGTAQIGDAAIVTAKIGDAQIIGAKIADAAITNAKIADATIGSAKIADLDAGKITTGTLSADRIAANSLTTEKLLIGDLTSQVENGTFATGNLSGWDTVGAGVGVASGSGPGGVTTMRAYLTATAAVQRLISRTAIAVQPGDVWVMSCQASTAMTSAGSIGIGIVTDAGVFSVTAIPNSNGAWTRYTHTYTVPAGVSTIRATVGIDGGPSPAGAMWVDNVSLRRANGGELIVDGAIVAGSAIIANGAISEAQIGTLSANKITTGTLDAGRIGALSITGDKIAANAITAAKLSADAINGRTITGSTLQTAASGARIVIRHDINALQAFNSSGVNTVSIDGSGASITAGTITGTNINGNTITGGTVTGATVQTAQSGARVVMDAFGLNGYDDNGANIFQLANGQAYVPQGMWVGSDGRLEPATPGGNGIALRSGSEYLTIDNTGASVSNLFGILNPTTTTSAANVRFSTAQPNGSRLYQVSSLRRYKRRIRNLDAHDLLKLRPRTWYDRGEVERAGLPAKATDEQCRQAGLRRIPGFIAEEVEAVDPLWCTYDEDGTLTGVAYDRLAAGLLVVAQHQAATITELTTRLDAIETRLAAIEEA